MGDGMEDLLNKKPTPRKYQLKPFTLHLAFIRDIQKHKFLLTPLLLTETS